MSNKHPLPLLTEIERDLLDQTPVADVLRKLIILGGRAGSSELRDWASHELRGYPDAESLPDYRKIPAIIQMDAVLGRSQISGQTIAPYEFPAEIRDHVRNEVLFFQGIGEIEALTRSREKDQAVRMALPEERMIGHLIDQASGNPLQHITSIYWSVSIPALEGLIDQVRTRLAELLGELRAATPGTSELPTAAQATNAVNIVVHGKGNRVQVAHGEQASANALDVGEPSDGPFWTLGRQIGAGIVGVATVVGVIITWWQWQFG